MTGKNTGQRLNELRRLGLDDFGTGKTPEIRPPVPFDLTQPRQRPQTDLGIHLSIGWEEDGAAFR